MKQLVAPILLIFTAVGLSWTFIMANRTLFPFHSEQLLGASIYLTDIDMVPFRYGLSTEYTGIAGREHIPAERYRVHNLGATRELNQIALHYRNKVVNAPAIEDGTIGISSFDGKTSRTIFYHTREDVLTSPTNDTIRAINLAQARYGPNAIRKVIKVLEADSTAALTCHAALINSPALQDGGTRLVTIQLNQKLRSRLLAFIRALPESAFLSLEGVNARIVIEVKGQDMVWAEFPVPEQNEKRPAFLPAVKAWQSICSERGWRPTKAEEFGPLVRIVH